MLHVLLALFLLTTCREAYAMIKSRHLRYLLPVWLLLWAVSCQKDDFGKKLAVEPFDIINIGENVQVNIWQADDYSLLISGTGNKEAITARVEGGTLNLAAANGKVKSVTIQVYTPNVARIVYRQNSVVNFPAGYNMPQGMLQIDGRNSAQLFANDTLKIGHLSMDLRDTSTLAIEYLRGAKLTVIERNYNFCNIAGNVQQMHLNLFNQATFGLNYVNTVVPYQYPVEAEECYVEVRGKTHAWVYALEKLRVEGYGDSKVYYKGTPGLLQANLYNSTFIFAKEQ